MAKRPAAARSSAAVRIIDAALALAAREGWRSISLAAIAAEAGMTVLELYAVYRSKTAILEAFHVQRCLAPAGTRLGPAGTQPALVLARPAQKSLDGA